MSEIVWSGFVAAAGLNTVQLSPDQNAPAAFTRPPSLRIDQITITTNASTPPTDFFGATGGCVRFDVILRRRF